MKGGEKYGVSQIDAPSFSAMDVQELLNKIKSLETDLYFSQATIRELVEAAEQALQYVEADETTHGRQFGVGNVLRAVIEKATKEGRG